MRMMILRAVVCGAITVLATQVSRAADEVPGAHQTQPIAIIGGTIHTVSGETIAQGTLVFDAGKITAVGKQVDLPEGAKSVDATGKHVYPALFESYSQIGLVEIDAVRATLDFAESGSINPNVEAHKAVNPDSELIPVARSNGVLLAVSAPSGGRIAGQSAVLQLDGWTWEQMTLVPRVAMHASWPRVWAARSRWQPDSEQRNERRSALLREFDKTLEDARAFLAAKSSRKDDQANDTRWASMARLLAGEQPLVVEADELQAIQEVVAFADRQNLRLIIFGGYDAELAAPLLKHHNIPVIIGGVYRVPQRRSDPYDAPYTLPDRLRRAGVTYCVSGAQRRAASNVGNLPYHAATAVAYGLPHAEAIRAITLYPAQILGVADRVGSLETGKDATFFLADGDILETSTHVESAYIQGREVDLNNRHKRLYQKYAERLRREK